MKKSIMAMLVLLISCGMIFAATSVQEQVGTAQQDAEGAVVTIGLSNYEGVQFALSGGYYAAAQPGAKAVAVGSGGGNKYGPGARLQYTLFGSGGTYKISALTDESGDGNIFVGVTEVTDDPVSGERTSGSIGTINTDTDVADYNGESGIARSYGLGSDPAMFLLNSVTADTLITSIASADTWTGTTSDDGPQLYYELTDTISCVVTYTIAAEV